MSAADTVNQFLDHELPGELANVLTTDNTQKAMQAIEESWSAEIPAPPTETPRGLLSYAKPEAHKEEAAVEEAVWMLKGGVVGVAVIPTLDYDPLLASARGRWRMPKTLQRADFERTFSMKARATTTLEEILALIRKGHWPTASAFSREYGKPHSWVRSLMWLCLREKLVFDTTTWHSYFPLRSKTRKPRQPKRELAHSGPAESFFLPLLDDDDEIE